MNDPNGFIYFKGLYHLFYQCFPYAPQWGRMHWGHVVSKDLVSWENQGIALYPSKTDDRSGCFSGTAVENDGKMQLYFTGVNYLVENPENINHCVDLILITLGIRKQFFRSSMMQKPVMRDIPEIRRSGKMATDGI